MTNKLNQDQIVNGMDWMANENLANFELSNYRNYQYNLISKHIGVNILEIGAGDRSFTNQIVKNSSKKIERIISIEPSNTLMEVYETKFLLPDYVKLTNDNLFDLTPDSYGQFDTIILIHVMEHIEEDKKAISHLSKLLKPDGKILIEVPALKFLYSIHDKMLGHYRRYNKFNFNQMVDKEVYKIDKLFYNDAIGVFGSLYYFKLKKINLKSDSGIKLANNQGKIYDKYIIPFEKWYESFLTIPFGLSLTGIISKK
jgi:2-polyprenyl-3-methyl-5-hydroxy-6-metoxy-1,4-benzoquinol methylase